MSKKPNHPCVSLLLVVGSGLLCGAVEAASFTDPTARLINPQNIAIGDKVYVAPFATLKAGSDPARAIHIGNESDVQDSVTLDANGPIDLGEQVIVAHGATVKGPASIGEGGTCPRGADVCPSFVGFNARVEGAVQKDAMVQTLARVGPGVTIPSGRKVLPGKNVASQAEVKVKTAPVTDADRLFMRGVIEVNLCFAEQYPLLEDKNPDNVRGINFDPDCPFNLGNQLPTLAGKETRDPAFRNRIIGAVHLANSKARLNEVMGVNISLRADEGEPFEVGTIDSMADRTIFHALEHTHLHLGNNGRYGYRSLVHGGPTPFDDTTITGNNFRLEDEAVFFRSRIGANSRVGRKSLVQQSDLPAGTIVPPQTVVIENKLFGQVEW